MFISSVDEHGFNLKSLDERVTQCKSEYKKGNLRWENEAGGDVEFVDDDSDTTA